MKTLANLLASLEMSNIVKLRGLWSDSEFFVEVELLNSAEFNLFWFPTESVK